MITFVCDRCGAQYEHAEIGIGICQLPADGGGRCGGKIATQLTGRPDPSATYVMSVDPAAVKPYVITEALKEILSRAEMRRGAVYPDGTAAALMEFRDAEDRAEFANLIAYFGGKLTA